MPGVPVGRACDNCRKQKKKCDEASPTCSRCVRLQLVCVGSGQKRYKFKGPQFFRKQLHQGQKTMPCTADGQKHLVASPSLTPINGSDLLAISFVDAIKESTDIRYNLASNYGDFLGEAVRRLGTNQALDASIKALVTAHTVFCTRQDDITTALVHYSTALSQLRICLDDPVKACDANTLCAVMVLLICQGLNGAEGLRWTGHCEGAAQILRARGFYNPGDDFEQSILLSLRGPVLFEGILNHKIDFSPREWQMLVNVNSQGDTPEDQMMRCLAHLREFLYLRRNSGSGQDELLDHTLDLRSHYQEMKDISTGQRERLHVLEKGSSTVPEIPLSTRVHSACQAAYGVGLVIAIVYNCVLSALFPEDGELASDSAGFIADVLALARDAWKYRPLGSSYIALCLGAAWVGTTSDSMRLAVETAWEGYGRDFIPGLQKPPFTELEWTSRQLRLID